MALTPRACSWVLACPMCPDPPLHQEDGTPTPGMSVYEAEEWANLANYWSRRATRPQAAFNRMTATLARARGTVSDLMGGQISGASTGSASGTSHDTQGDHSRALTPGTTDSTPSASTPSASTPSASTAPVVADTSIPALHHSGGDALTGAATEMAADNMTMVGSEWLDEAISLVQQAVRSEKVLAFHRSHGHPVQRLQDLRDLDLEDLDAYTRRFATKSFGTGVAGGVAAGVVAGQVSTTWVKTVGADVAQVVLTASGIVARACQAYGLDPAREDQRPHLEWMLVEAVLGQIPKAALTVAAVRAAAAGAGRQRWSSKYRAEHPVAVAMEKAMQAANVNGSKRVPIQAVVAAMPWMVGAAAAATNGAVLRRVAVVSRQYARTVHLAEKYALPLPEGLA